MDKNHRNILMLEAVAKALGDLLPRVVFIGGATTALYIDDPAAPVSEPSDDVDFIIEVTSKGMYADFEAKLRERGFKDYVPAPGENGVLCRKTLGSIIVDVMPTDPKILGFSNQWYVEGIRERAPHVLPSGAKIQTLTLPYFFATKLVAYLARGKSNMRESRDLEDILSVLDGCQNVQAKLKSAPDVVATYIRAEFSKLLKNPDLMREAAIGFLVRIGEPPTRIDRLLSIVGDLATKP